MRGHMMKLPNGSYPFFEAQQAEFPGFKYKEPKLPKGQFNFGHQQRAFTVYWALQMCSFMDLGIDLGSHRSLTPLCIHVDRWYDNEHEHPIYGGVHPADVIADATRLHGIFPKNTFPYVCSSHSLEHMDVPGDAGASELLCRWLELLRPGGVLALVIPDNDHWDVMASDKDHRHAWGAKDFKQRVLERTLAASRARLVEYDNFDNHYSFNVLLERT